jgi:hypothetical protein
MVSVECLVRRRARIVTPFFTLSLLVLLCARAEAQEANTTDPTEPTTKEPALVYPKSEPAAPVGDQAPVDAQPADDEGSNGAVDEEVEELSIPGDPWGDVGSEGLLTLRALFQARYIQTWARDSDAERESYRVREDWLARQGDGFSLNRIFVRFGSEPSRYLGFKAVMDLGELIENDPEDVLKQAYVTFRPIPKHVEIVAGLFKVPFSILELDASSRFEFAEFGQVNALTGQLNYAGRDIGVQVLVAPLRKAKRLRLTVGAFRGHAENEHASPVGSVGGRIETKPNKHWRFGADVMHHTADVSYRRPFSTSNNDIALDPPDPNFPASRTWKKGTAFSGDFRYKRKGFMLRGEGIYGDRVDYDERYSARTFWAAWGLLAYRIDIGPLRLLPAIRYEWFDANLEQDSGIFSQLTTALSFLFLERVRVILDVTMTDVQDNTPVLNQRNPLQPEPYLALDNVRGTLQLQVEL